MKLNTRAVHHSELEDVLRDMTDLARADRVPLASIQIVPTRVVMIGGAVSYVSEFHLFWMA